MAYNYEPSNALADPILYNELLSHARRMRGNATLAEQRLWECLRGKGLGVKFRRQHPIDGYIADFICLTEMLIIEVDGGYHQDYQQEEADILRTEKLNKLGYRVIRFSNEEVLYNTDNVLSTIRDCIRFSEIEK